MRSTIDTEIDRIIVPDIFFNQIDERNAVFEEHGGKDEKKIDYVEDIKEAMLQQQTNSRQNKMDASRKIPGSIHDEKLISDTKCGIERNNFFIVLEAEVFGREFDCISGLVGVHIDL